MIKLFVRVAVSKNSKKYVALVADLGYRLYYLNAAGSRSDSVCADLLNLTLQDLYSLDLGDYPIEIK